jgi:hypothetical protein
MRFGAISAFFVIVRDCLPIATIVPFACGGVVDWNALWG